MAAGYSDILQHHTLLPWKNDSSERCPPFGVFRVTGVEGRRIKGEKPSSTFGRMYAVNGDTAVPAGGTGQCCMGVGCLALFDTGSPANGEGWGPKPGQWALSRDYPRIATIGGVYDSTKKIARVTLGSIDSLFVKADSSIAKESTGTFSIWTRSGGTDTTINVTARATLNFMETLFGVAEFINGEWHATPLNRLLVGKADADISKGSSGTVSVYTGSAGSETDSGINVTASALGAAITSAKWVTVAVNENGYYVGPWEC